MRIKIIITDDHPLAINGIRMMLEGLDHIEIIDTCTSGTQLLEVLAVLQPDVLLLDLLLPDYSGSELVKIIQEKYPEIRIVVLTSLGTLAMVQSMMQHGCTGYLLKDTDRQTLILAIEHAYNKEEFIEPSLKEQLLNNLLKARKENAQPEFVLTKREKQILQFIVAGDTNQEIAEKLFISSRTAEAHRINLLKKLNAKNSANLALKAVQLGLIET